MVAPCKLNMNCPPFAALRYIPARHFLSPEALNCPSATVPCGCNDAWKFRPAQPFDRAILICATKDAIRVFVPRGF